MYKKLSRYACGFVILVGNNVFATITAVPSKVDPLSKIVITSTSAQCVRDDKKQGNFILTYQGDVHVTFADQSTVTAETLKIVLDGKQGKKIAAPGDKKPVEKQQKDVLSNFKQITFKKNVHVVSGQRKAVADMAHFYLPQQRCVLEGNVKIWQTKQKPDDVPVAVQSQKAELFLQTGAFNFIGTAKVPVNTTIVLEDHPALKNKKDSKDPKKKNVKNSPSSAKRSA